MFTYLLMRKVRGMVVNSEEENLILTVILKDAHTAGHVGNSK